MKISCNKVLIDQVRSDRPGRYLAFAHGAVFRPDRPHSVKNCNVTTAISQRLLLFFNRSPFKHCPLFAIIHSLYFFKQVTLLSLVTAAAACNMASKPSYKSPFNFLLYTQNRTRQYAIKKKKKKNAAAPLLQLVSSLLHLRFCFLQIVNNRSENNDRGS